MKALDVQPGQWVEARDTSGRVIDIRRSIGVGQVLWLMEDGRVVEIGDAEKVDAW